MANRSKLWLYKCSYIKSIIEHVEGIKAVGIWSPLCCMFINVINFGKVEENSTLLIRLNEKRGYDLCHRFLR